MHKKFARSIYAARALEEIPTSHPSRLPGCWRFADPSGSVRFFRAAGGGNEGFCGAAQDWWRQAIHGQHDDTSGVGP